MASTNTALYAAKQALLLAAGRRKDTVLFGSCATDRYVPPCMCFGESHQDIDLFLIVSSDLTAESYMLDDFVYSVVKVVESYPFLNLCPEELTWTVTMASTGLYCAHVSARGCHFSDITLLPSTLNQPFEDLYPRKRCEVYLSLFLARVFQTVISVQEVVYRLQCIITSVEMVDGLRCLPCEYNKAAIVKSARRLQRLKVLEVSSALHTEPLPWFFDVDYDIYQLQQSKLQACITQQTRMPPNVPIETATATASTGIQVNMDADGFTRQKRCIGLQFEAFEEKIALMEAGVVAKLACIGKKLAAVETRGSQLCDALNENVKQSSNMAKEVLLSAADTLNTFRTTAYLLGHEPQALMKQVLQCVVDDAGPVLREYRRHSQHTDATIGDYEEPIARIRTEMAAKDYFPFNLISSFTKKFDVDGIFPSLPVASCTLSAKALRDYRTLHGIKESLLGSFSVFQRMLVLAGAKELVEDSGSSGVPYATWASKPGFMHQLTKCAEGYRAFTVPTVPYIPCISVNTGALDFVPLIKEREILAMQNVAAANALPYLDEHNAEFLLHMFDNVIGHVTLPVLAHVQLLKRNIQALGAVFDEIKDAAEGYIRKSSKAPIVKYVETIRLVRQSIYEAAAKFGAAESDGPVFSWKPRDHASKNKHKNKNKNRNKNKKKEMKT